MNAVVLPWPDNPASMAKFRRKYTTDQRKAIFAARFDRGETYAHIAKLAATGELIPGQPFTIGPEYLGEICREQEARRVGKVESPLADKPHRDAVEVLRRRMISVADNLSDDLEKLASKKPDKVDPERARQVARLLREVASIPSPKEETPRAPGSNAGGQRQDSQTRGGAAGALLAAHRATTRQSQDQAEYADQAQQQDDDAQQDEAQSARSGSQQSASGAPLAAPLVVV